MDQPSACIFDAASNLPACVAPGPRKQPPHLVASSSICLAHVSHRSGPWLTFNSALTATGRRLSKHGLSNGGVPTGSSHQRIGGNAHAADLRARALNEPGAVWRDAAVLLAPARSRRWQNQEDKNVEPGVKAPRILQKKL